MSSRISIPGLAVRGTLAAVFVGVGLRKLMRPHSYARYMRRHGLNSATLPILYFAGVTELCGGLAFVSGISTRLTSAGLAVFLIPTTLIFHPFWNRQGFERELQWIDFMKNVAIFGGLLGVGLHRDHAVRLLTAAARKPPALELRAG